MPEQERREAIGTTAPVAKGPATLCVGIPFLDRKLRPLEWTRSPRTAEEEDLLDHAEEGLGRWHSLTVITYDARSDSHVLDMNKGADVASRPGECFHREKAADTHGTLIVGPFNIHADGDGRARVAGGAEHWDLQKRLAIAIGISSASRPARAILICSARFILSRNRAYPFPQDISSRNVLATEIPRFPFLADSNPRLRGSK
jgi:hypothetical protein